MEDIQVCTETQSLLEAVHLPRAQASLGLTEQGRGFLKEILGKGTWEAPPHLQLPIKVNTARWEIVSPSRHFSFWLMTLLGCHFIQDDFWVTESLLGSRTVLALLQICVRPIPQGSSALTAPLGQCFWSQGGLSQNTDFLPWKGVINTKKKPRERCTYAHIPLPAKHSQPNVA